MAQWGQVDGYRVEYWDVVIGYGGGSFYKGISLLGRLGFEL